MIAEAASTAIAISCLSDAAQLARGSDAMVVGSRNADVALMPSRNAETRDRAFIYFRIHWFIGVTFTQMLCVFILTPGQRSGFPRYPGGLFPYGFILYF